MTNSREKEIEKAAKEMADNWITIGNRQVHRPDVIQHCFEKGAKWADAHQRVYFDELNWADLDKTQAENKLLRQQLAIAKEALEYVDDLQDRIECHNKVKSALAKISEAGG